jgi:hypothetical protein
LTLRTAQSLPIRALDAGLRPGQFPDPAASLLPGLLAATRTGLTPAGDDELTLDQVKSNDHLQREDEASVQGLVELRSTVSRLDRLRDWAPELVTLLTRWVPTRVLSQVVEQALADLDLAPVVKVPARAAVGQAGAEDVPLTISAPDGCVAMAYEQLVSRLGAAREVEPEGALR